MYNHDKFANTGEKHLSNISVFVFYVWCTFVLLDIGGLYVDNAFIEIYHAVEASGP